MLGFLACGLASILTLTAQIGGPPATEQEPVREVLHGTEIVDPFRWLEDPKSPRTRAWIAEQNAYTDKILAGIPGREKIARRLGELLRTESISAPIARGDRYFFSKRKADQDLAVIYLRKGLRGADEALIDPHVWSDDHTTSVSLLDVSKDGRLLAYGVRQGGEDELTVRVLDVGSRKDLPDELPRGRYFGVSIGPHNRRLFYSRHGKEGSRVFIHRLGAKVDADEEIFGKGYGPGVIISPSLSDDGEHLLLTVIHGSAADKTELYVRSTAEGAPIREIVANLPYRFSGEIAGGKLFVQTNWNAPNNRVMVASLDDPAPARWREIIPAGPAVIESVSLVGGTLLVHQLQDVHSVLLRFDPSGEALGEVALPTIGSVTAIAGRWRDKETFFEFSSFAVPPTIFRLELPEAKTSVWSKTDLPIDPAAFELTQKRYASKDGSKIPIFLLRKKGSSGPKPTLMTGYGGFNISLTPKFSAAAVVWAEQGGLFALPNLRGGGEFGEAWHRAGMREKKQNVFDDFLSAARWLVDAGDTPAGKLAISGRSNGGLLVGAAVTQAPELFRAAVCGYPLLDMVRYHQFLVARFWVPEYGSSENSDQFPYLWAYSPYHRVQKGTKYPAILFVSGDSDTRVDPLHARKMAALMQLSTGSDRPILLRYDVKAGHSAGRPVRLTIEDQTAELSFMLWQLGATAGSP